MPPCRVNRARFSLELIAGSDVPEGAPENFAIEEETAVSEVIEVVVQTTKHLLESVGITVVEGCVRGDAGTYLIEIVITRIGLFDLVDKVLTLGTITYKGHVAHKDIPKLGEFVEMVIADEASDLGETRVAIDVEQLGFAVGFSIGRHRAELVDFERASAFADAFLTENSVASVLKFDGNEAYHKEGEEDNEAQGGNDNVERALIETPESRHAILNVSFGEYEFFCLSHRIYVKGVYKIRCEPTLIT